MTVHQTTAERLVFVESDHFPRPADQDEAYQIRDTLIERLREKVAAAGIAPADVRDMTLQLVTDDPDLLSRNLVGLRAEVHVRTP